MLETPKASSSSDKSGGATGGAKQTAKRKSISAKGGSAKVDDCSGGVPFSDTPA